MPNDCRKALTSGPFVTRIDRNIGNYARGTLKSRVLQILHEVGHLVIVDTKSLFRVSLSNGNVIIRKNFIALVPLLEIDGGNSELSKSNTKKVEGNCGNQIDSIQD